MAEIGVSPGPCRRPGRHDEGEGGYRDECPATQACGEYSGA
jgi:hypothetical protein